MLLRSFLQRGPLQPVQNRIAAVDKSRISSLGFVAAHCGVREYASFLGFSPALIYPISLPAVFSGVFNARSSPH